MWEYLLLVFCIFWTMILMSGGMVVVSWSVSFVIQQIIDINEIRAHTKEVLTSLPTIPDNDDDY